jgi:hypothetical protein
MGVRGEKQRSDQELFLSKAVAWPTVYEVFPGFRLDLPTRRTPEGLQDKILAISYNTYRELRRLTPGFL